MVDKENRPFRVLLITRNLPPLVGGMERLNWHMAEELSRRADVRVIGPTGSAAMAPADVSITEIPLRPLWRFLAQAQWQAMREARRWRPDVVLAGSGLTAPAAWMAARACGACAAVYVHGLDISARHPVYRALWRPVLRRMDRVIANSHPTRCLAEDIGIPTSRMGIVHPGVDLPEPATPEVAVHFRAIHGFAQSPLLLSVGRLSARKGLREFVLRSLPLVVSRHPDVRFLVVGDAPADALNAHAQTVESIREAARQVGVEDNLEFLGRLTDVELAVVYAAADVHVFPVREIPGDPEGFGMVAVEAAAHGLPTVAFAAGGIVDAVAEGQSGYLVKPGDYSALSDAVVQSLVARKAMRLSCQQFAQRFAWPAFGEQLERQLATKAGSSPALFL